MKKSILLADDDKSIRFVLSKFLTQAGYEVKATDNPKTLLKWVEAGEGSVILTDVHMGTEEVFTYLPDIKNARPELPVIVFSANTRMLTALKSKRSGVFAYLPKPFDLNELKKTIESALQTPVASPPRKDKNVDAMIGQSSAMQPVFQAISDYASARVPVYIWGDVGVGKTLTARTLHDAGARKNLKFLNLSQIDNLNDVTALQSELHGGDLLIDRVHELDSQRQSFLLRLFESAETHTSSTETQFRAIFTSDLSLQDLSDAKVLRPDLLSHFIGAQIYVPSLSQRPEDIGSLVEHFLALALPKGHAAVEPAAVQRMEKHIWTGNVREMRNLMQVIAHQYGDRLITTNIVDGLLQNQSPPSQSKQSQQNLQMACRDLLRTQLGELERSTRETPSDVYEQALAFVERPLFVQALQLTNGNRSKAATLLGIHRNTLRTKLKQYGL